VAPSLFSGRHSAPLGDVDNEVQPRSALAYTCRQVTAGVSIYLVSACSTGEEFVAAFRRYADRGSLFVPISEPIPAGRRGRFALTLAGGGVLVEGDAEVISSSKIPSVLHGRVGMTIRFGDLDDNSKTVLIELEKARLVAKPPAPSISPRVVELPEGPRPKPPAVSVRIDASVALAECTALGDLEALEKTTAAPPKAGPKFVVPSVPPVGTPRPATPGAVPVARPNTPSGAHPVARPKPPSVPPAMPPLPPSGPAKLPPIAERPPGPFSATMLAVPPAPPERPKLSLDAALAKASREIEAAKTEAMDVPPAPFTPSSMDAVEGPRTEAMDVPPAPMTPTEMAAVPPPPAAAKQTPEWMLMTVRSASPPPPTPAPPVIGTPPVRQLLEPDLDEPTDLTTMPIIPEDTGRKTSLGLSAIQREPAPLTVRRPPTTDGDDVPVEIVDTMPPELDSRPVAIDDADTSVTEQPPEAVQMPAAVRSRTAKPPTVEEPTPSGDWTITPGVDRPTIEPRKPAPSEELTPIAQAPDVAPQPEGPPTRITGNWTIQLDPSAVDGWSEPSKVDAVALPDPDPAAEKPKKKRTKPTPETPPELRPVARSIMMEALPAAPPAAITPSEEPKVQIDPTLMEAPIVDPSYGAPSPATLSALMPAQVPSISAQLPAVMPQEVPVMAVQQQVEQRRLATPVPGTMSPMMPIDRPTPSPIGIDPRVTPLPAKLVAQFPPPGSPSMPGPGLPRPATPHPTQRPDLAGRLVTDGGVGFFRDSGEIANLSGSGSFPVGDSTSLVEVRRRRRLVVIGISAAVVVALGIVAVVMFAGGDKKDDATTTSDAASVAPLAPKDAATQVVVAPPDARVEAPPPDAAVVAPPKGPECTVEVTTVPPGAELLVQGSLDVLGVSPAKLPLPCGLEVRLLVRKQRFANVIRPVTPTEAGVAMRITLQKLLFSVKVSSTPAGATISLNGKAVAVTPTTMKLPAFELSTVTFSKDGFTVDTQKITPKQNNQTVHAVLKKKPRR
jgi:hypothetical protein